MRIILKAYDLHYRVSTSALQFVGPSLCNNQFRRLKLQRKRKWDVLSSPTAPAFTSQALRPWPIFTFGADEQNCDRLTRTASELTRHHPQSHEFLSEGDSLQDQGSRSYVNDITL